jgi:hypothetical protein
MARSLLAHRLDLKRRRHAALSSTALLALARSLELKERAVHPAQSQSGKHSVCNACVGPESLYSARSFCTTADLELDFCTGTSLSCVHLRARASSYAAATLVGKAMS